MGSLISSRKSTVVTKQDRIVLQLKIQRDELNRYTKRVENQLERDRMLAKKLLSQGRKDKALLLLKKKKYLDNLIDKTAGQLSTIESLIYDLEFAQMEMRVLDGLKQGNEALKKIHQMVSLDDAERIMSETREAIDYQRELNAIVSSGLTSEETEGLEEELNSLLNEVKLELPEVPDHELPEHPVRETGKDPSRSHQRTHQSDRPLMAS